MFGQPIRQASNITMTQIHLTSTQLRVLNFLMALESRENESYEERGNKTCQRRPEADVTAYPFKNCCCWNFNYVCAAQVLILPLSYCKVDLVSKQYNSLNDD
jgi:hypothetical protein